MPYDLGVPPAFARQRPARRRAATTGASAATTSALDPGERAGHVPARGHDMTPAEPTPDRGQPAGHWFEADPLWFKTGGLLRDPPARVLRRQRRRLRRLPRADREARLPAVARHRLHLAAADVRQSRCATAATTSPTTTTIHPDYGTIEDVRAFIEAAHERGHPRDRRPRHEPHLVRPRVVPARARGAARLARARLVRLVGHRRTATRTRGSSSSTPRRRTGRGTRRPAPTSGTASSPTSPTSTSTTPRSRRRCSTSCASGWTSASTASASTPCPTSTSARARTARTCPRPTSSSRGCARRSTTSTPTASCSPRPTSGPRTSSSTSATATSATWPSTSRSCRACSWRCAARRPRRSTRSSSARPAIPDNCQWGLFLRNHDELTLEMVTDEERDYMYAEYAKDPRMKINVGIRRRLAPLLDSGRDEMELMHAILFSLPGSPGPLLRRRDRDGRQRLPRRPRRRAHADAVDRRPQRRLLPRRLRPALRAAADGPGLRLPGRQRRGAAAHADVAAALAASASSRCARSTRSSAWARYEPLRADQPEDLRPRPPLRGRHRALRAQHGAVGAGRRARSVSVRRAARPRRCSAARASRASASCPTC